MSGLLLDEQRIAAYVAGELSETQRAAVEQALDDNPEWLAVVAAVTRARPKPDDSVPDPSAAAGAGADVIVGGIPLSGTRVGRYIVGAPLGQGAHGVVCAAWDPELRRDVALKLVDPSLLTDAGRAHTRLLREAKALARLDDRHVVRVFDVGSWRGRVFIAMERLDGGTLDLWRRDHLRGWAEVVSRWIEAGRGLAAAHGYGLVHRDFKPSNAMLDGDGRVVVVDFGLVFDVGATPNVDAVPLDSAELQPSVSGSDLTRTGVAVGTPAYMAPEQRGGGTVTAAADQYAWSVSLYEALTGTLPDGVVRAPMVALSDSVPRRVFSVLARGRSSSAAHRYPDFSALLDAVDACLHPHRRRRHWYVLGAGAAVVALAWGLERSPASPCDSPPSASYGDISALLQSVSAVAGAPTDQVQQTVTAWSEAWENEYGRACEQWRTGVFGDGRLDRALTCLQQQRRDATTTLDELRETPPQTSAALLTGIAGLPVIGECHQTATEDEGLSEADRAESLAIRSELREIERERHRGNFADLNTRGADLVHRADRLRHEPLRARTRLVLGASLELSADVVRAGDVYERGAEIAMAAEAEDLAARLLVRAAWLVSQGPRDPVRSRTLIEHAAAWSSRVGSDPALEADRFRTLGHVELLSGAADKALVAFERAYQLSASLPDSNYEAYDLRVVTECDWASALFAVDEFEASRQHFEHAAQARLGQVGAEHPSVAEINTNIAVLLRADGRYADSLALLTDALVVFERAYGPDSPRLGTTLLNVAVVELDLGRPAAQQHAARAVVILEKLYGNEAMIVANAKVTLGEAQFMSQEFELGVSNIQDGRALTAAGMGEDHVEVGLADTALGAGWIELGRGAEALAAYQAALRTLQPHWGEQDPRLAVVHAGVGRAELLLGHLEQADVATAHAVALGGPPQLAEAHHARAEFLVAAGRVAESVPVFERALAACTTTPAAPQAEFAIRLDLARALLSLEGDPGRSTTLAKDVLTRATALGLSQWPQRAQAVLDATPSPR